MLSLYIHIPFCKQKCLYCDFCSFTDSSKIDKYIDSVSEEIKMYASAITDRNVISIFIGGGTPSVLYPRHLTKLFACIRKYFNVQKNAEITIEANPESLNSDFLVSGLENGINRLSIGVQSLDNTVLKYISRIHKAETALSAICLAKSTGYTNINVDLMYGLPMQNIDTYTQTLKSVLDLNVQHISLYNLIVEDNTPLKLMLEKGTIIIPDEEQQINMYRLGKTVLECNGFLQYEISNYSKPGYQCRHNLVYWQHGNYLGIGVAAHSFICNRQCAKRFSNSTDLKSYFNLIDNKKIFVKTQILNKDDLKFERIMLGFRLIDGVSISKFNKDFDCDFIIDYKKEIDELCDHKLLIVDGDRVYLTARGIELENSVLMKFMK